MHRTLLSLPGNRLFWGGMGITALACLIWIAGPFLKINVAYPLESTTNRQILIGLCYIVWLLQLLLPRLYKAWFNRKLLTQLQPSAEYQATEALLTTRFNEAVGLLKKKQFGQQKKGSWLQRCHTEFLYQLPWYILLGAPGAGKTTALMNSGLQFPLSDNHDKKPIRGVGGTRHCDWWFTDSAVLLDTAGRYTLQESMRERDASEWQTFINLLKQYRTYQPINGVIMTISVADLLSGSHKARQTQALALRERMTELQQQTGINFPVYIMVTKTDLLKGFMHYFSSLDKQQREQVWGFTFPWEPGKNTWSDMQELFDQRFQRLSQQLVSTLPEKMIHQADLQHRTESFLFPQEFASLRPLLAEYLNTVFCPGNGDEGEAYWYARGVFFTSGTQEGLPFDRIMGELSRKLQLPQNQANSIAAWDSVNRSAPIPANHGQSYFIHDLLRQVIFKEKGLAGSDFIWEQRSRLFYGICYSTLAAALLAVSLLWLSGYYQNKHYMQLVAARLPQISQQSQHFLATNTGDLLDLLPLLNNLINLPQPVVFSLDNPPVSMRAGLYRGDQISDACWELYRNALKSLLLPRVAQRITIILRNDKGDDDQFSRQALKAYQMLYQPHNYDGEFLRHWIMQNIPPEEAKKVVPRDLQQLDWHLSQLLDRQIQSSPYAHDNTLITRKLVNRQSAQQQTMMPMELSAARQGL